MHAALIAFTLLTAVQPPSSMPAYAIIVGSNAGGNGQTPLRYAEADARTMADVLTELGAYDPARVRLLLSPKRDSVLQVIEDVEAAMDRNAQREEPARLFFYYSGHARADALNLGADELPLTELRQRLRSMPATLTVVILDACQSGAFSRTKGAGPASDFSFNSVHSLGASGIAVLASSSAAELSQESDALAGSFFTHHLSVGLRGAADVNNDGQVSLDEAYHYAYAQTLAATALTAVGGQHATFETELKGKGEVPLTYPADATAHLVLGAEIRGPVLIQNKDSGAIAAEVHKAAGDTMKLALPAGEYQAVLRDGDAPRVCNVRLSDNATTGLGSEECNAVAAQATASKGDTVESRISGHLEIEAALGPAFSRANVPMYEMGLEFGKIAMLSAVYRISEHVGLVPQLMFTSFTSGSGYNLGANLRASTGFSNKWEFLLQLGVGPSILTGYAAPTTLGYNANISGGMQVHLTEGVGLVFQLGSQLGSQPTTKVYTTGNNGDITNIGHSETAYFLTLGLNAAVL